MRIHLITKFSIMRYHRPTDDYINGLGLYYGIWTMVSSCSDEVFSLITSIRSSFFNLLHVYVWGVDRQYFHSGEG